MSIKLNKNLVNTQKNLYSNNIKTFTGFYSDSWITTITTPSGSYNSLAINEDGLIFAVGNEIIAYSDNGGNSWLSITSAPLNNNWKSITYSQTLQRFVIVGYGATNYIVYSNKKNPTSASDWIVATSGVVNLQWEDVIWGDGVFIAIASSGSGIYAIRRILVSRNGINWRIDTPPLELISELNNWKSITYGNGVFVAVSSSANSTNYSRIIYSNNDGNIWAECRNSSSSINLVKSANSWQDITYSPKLNLFIAVANSGSYRLIYSYDGQNWSNDDIPASINSLSLTSIIWSLELGMFVAISSNSSPSRFITSSNGINWTERSFPISSKTTSSIIWNKIYNNFIACSSATAAPSNIYNTIPLGVNSLLSNPDYALNKTSLNNFSYIKSSETQIDMLLNVNFGVPPITNINIHNEYKINIPFPPGININPNNGVIWGNYSKPETIEREITVTNTATNQRSSNTIKINFLNKTPNITSFYYKIKNSNSTDTSNYFVLSENNKIYELEPLVDSIGPYRFLITNLTTDYNNYLNLDPVTGILRINTSFIIDSTIYITVKVINNFEESVNNSEITLTILSSIVLPFDPSYYKFLSNTFEIQKKTTAYQFELWTDYFGVLRYGEYQRVESSQVKYYNEFNGRGHTGFELSISFTLKTRTFNIIAAYIQKIIREPYNLPSGYSFVPSNNIPNLDQTILLLTITGFNNLTEARFFNTIRIFGNTYSINDFQISFEGSKKFNYIKVLNVNDFPGQDTSKTGITIIPS